MVTWQSCPPFATESSGKPILPAHPAVQSTISRIRLSNEDYGKSAFQRSLLCEPKFQANRESSKSVERNTNSRSCQTHFIEAIRMRKGNARNASPRQGPLATRRKRKMRIRSIADTEGALQEKSTRKTMKMQYGKLRKKTSSGGDLPTKNCMAAIQDFGSTGAQLYCSNL